MATRNPKATTKAATTSKAKATTKAQPAKAKPDMSAAATRAWITIRCKAALGYRGDNYDKVRAKLIRDGQLKSFTAEAKRRKIAAPPAPVAKGRSRKSA